MKNMTLLVFPLLLVALLAAIYFLQPLLDGINRLNPILLSALILIVVGSLVAVEHKVPALRKNLPLNIVLVFGLIFVVQYFIPSKKSQLLFDTTVQWEIIMGIPAIVIGLDSLTRHHFIKINRKKPGWPYSIVYLGGAVLMALVGIVWGIREGSPFMQLFNNVQAPMQSTVFSLLAFYMSSAAYRAFRARSAQATVLLLSAFVLMIGLIPIGAKMNFFLPWFVKTAQGSYHFALAPISLADASEWLMMVPNMASKRAIAFGVGLGMAATTLKIMLGIERNWLGGGE